MQPDRRRFLFASASATLSVTLLPQLARANAPVAKAQVAGVQRFGFGDAVVSALSDGYVDLDASLFPTADAEAVNTALRDAFLDPDGSLRGAVNAYLVNTPERTVLIDSGGGNLLGGTMGRLDEHLDAAGVAPAAVDTILMTHLHPDHIGGLTGADGAPAFPNAEMLVHDDEIAYWRDDSIRNQAPDGAKGFFDAARAALDAYGERVTPFTGDVEVVPGIGAVHLPGHTPGHTGYRLDSGDRSLLVWGDIVHAPPLQFPHPDWTIAFDVDQDRARATRARVFDMAASERLPVGGMHLFFPGLGHVEKTADAYGFVPLRWQYVLSEGE